MGRDYIVFHSHDDTSNCNGYADSCTSYKEYIKLAQKHNMKAIAFSNHGGIYDWVKKKQECDKANIKYIHGVELYLCINLEDNTRGYHIGLYSKNLDGVKELNSLISKATSKGVREDKKDRHMYYNPRISFEELMSTSDNIIVTTACLASALWRLGDKDVLNKENGEEIYNYNIEKRKELLEWLSENKHRCFLEIQYHNCINQIKFNQQLYKWSEEYGIPLIAGTDTHSSTKYKAECRKILQKSKNSYYGEEDEFDLTWKSYDELVECFQVQNALPREVYLQAIENTNHFATMIEEFELDKSFKYPNLYGNHAVTLWWNRIIKKLKEKKEKNIIDITKLDKYKEKIREEFLTMRKQGMESFMLFMSDLVDFCMENDIPYGFGRGSVSGSVIAYITDITDVDPVKWNTVFSRFCNADRISLADIDMDFSPEDRAKVYKYIIERFTSQKTAYIAQFGTLKDRGTIDVLAKGLEYKNLDIVKQIKNSYDELFNSYSKIIQAEVNLEEIEETDAKSIDFDYHNLYCEKIRNEKAVAEATHLRNQFEKLKKENEDLFYYFDGLKGTIISKGNHPAGIIGSPITLQDNLGVFFKDGDESMPVCQCAMKAVDSLNYVKFDILGLKTVGILKDTYKYINSHYLKSHEINWNDKDVWKNMITTNVGVFQFEGRYAFDLLQKFKPQYINDMSLVNAALRPSGKSYRDRLINREFNKNPSKEIDGLLRENNGFLVYQEDTIKFLTDICGFSGSLADTTRRAIGKKDYDLLHEQLPKILKGYCDKSKKPKEIAGEEVKEFLQIIDDSSEYQFGYNHSTAYSMNGFACVRSRYYYPLEFTTAYLNRAENEDDLINGIELAKQLNIKIFPPQFRYSKANYMYDKETNSIYKGITSIKYLNTQVADQLYELRDNQYSSFITLLHYIKNNIDADFRQLKILTTLNYFSEFGKNKKLLTLINEYEKKLKNKKLKETTKDKRLQELIELEYTLENKGLNIKEQIKAEKEYYGYEVTTVSNSPESIYIITEIDTKYTPKLRAYNISTGDVYIWKCKKNNIKKNPFAEFSVLKIIKLKEKYKVKPLNNDWVQTDEKELELIDWEVIM